MPRLKADHETSLLEVASVEGRSIYLVVRSSIIYTSEGGIVALWASPLALVVVESGRVYSMNLAGERVALEDLMEVSPQLREMLGQSGDYGALAR